MPHIHDAIDFAVSVYVVYRNRVLFVHHSSLDLWLPVGGHIELDEDPEQAAYREVKEESGLDIVLYGEKPQINPIQDQATLLIPPIYMDIHKITDTHRHIGLIYFATTKLDNVTLAAKEHKAIRWLTIDELPNYNLLPQVRFYAEQAIKTLASSTIN